LFVEAEEVFDAFAVGGEGVFAVAAFDGASSSAWALARGAGMVSGS
jgi:hypothetical protein